MFTKGILIKNKKIDKKLLEILQNNFNIYVKNKVTIMYIIPTNTCNLMCKYCFIGKLDKNKTIMMSEETAIKAVDLFAEHLSEIKEEGTIFFYGAEPLINFKLLKIIVKYSKEKELPIKFAMVSNAILINEKIARFIKDNKISLGISIDGPKQITDKNRVFKENANSVYDIIIQKIKLLKQKKVDFGLSITVAPIFLENKQDFFEWIEKLNVKNISYNLLHFTEPNNEWKKYYKEATNFIYESNCKIFDKGFNEDRVNRKYKAFYDRKFKFSDCGAVGANQITICPDGRIEICHGYWNYCDNILGNINNLESMEELFTNDKYIFWQNLISINKRKCLNCESIYICGGGCAMQSKDVFGDEKNIDKGFCIYTKKMVKKILKEIYENDI